MQHETAKLLEWLVKSQPSYKRKGGISRQCQTVVDRYPCGALNQAVNSPWESACHSTASYNRPQHARSVLHLFRRARNRKVWLHVGHGRPQLGCSAPEQGGCRTVRSFANQANVLSLQETPNTSGRAASFGMHT